MLSTRLNNRVLILHLRAKDLEIYFNPQGVPAAFRFADNGKTVVLHKLRDGIRVPAGWPTPHTYEHNTVDFANRLNQAMRVAVLQ